MVNCQETSARTCRQWNIVYISICLVVICGSIAGCDNTTAADVELQTEDTENILQLLSEETSDQNGVHVLLSGDYLGSTEIHATKGNDITLDVVVGFNIDAAFFCRVDDRHPLVNIETPWTIKTDDGQIYRHNRVAIPRRSASTFLYFADGASATRRAVQENHGIVAPVDIPLASIPKSLDQVSVPIQIQIAIFDTASCTMYHLNEVRQLRIKLDEDREPTGE